MRSVGQPTGVADRRSDVDMTDAAALTDREYAYFVVTGPGRHEDVTKALDLRPSEAWNAGDINPQNGKPRRSMKWILKSDLDDTRALREHIDAIFAVIATRSNELRALWVEYDLVIQCVGYFPSWTHGADLDREIVRQAAQLGVAFDFDFYFVGREATERET
jgi:hypothetical protein